MEKEKINDNENIVTNIKMKHIDTTEYLKQHIKDEQIRRKTEALLSSPSPITEFKKVPNKNDVVCSLEDGTRYVVPVDQTLQLFFDKMEMHPDVVVDFGKEKKNRVEILPFQNRIVYINGETNEVIRSLPIDSNLLYTRTNSITGSYEQIDERLNPAVLAVLNSDLAAQKDYINGTGNINISYNFEKKSNKIKDNIANKDIAKRMNKYYESEKKYVEELNLDHKLSEKVGYVNMLDKIQSSLEKPKVDLEKSSDESVISFSKARETFIKGLQNYQVSSTSSEKSSENTKTHIPNKVITGLDR